MDDKKLAYEAVTIKGEVNPVVCRADGRVEDLGWFKNLFTGAGATYLAAFQSTTPGSVVNHMSVGTGTTAAALLDTTLVGQVGSRATMATRANVLNVLSEVASFTGFLSGVTSLVLREVGCFNATSGGTMRSRAVFSAITLADSDALLLTYRTTVGSTG
jgi:hypothetical protein